METRYELLVIINDITYYLDTFGDDAISLNYDIANIRDISGRNSSYSKTIRLPDSNHNREVLGFITNLSVDSTVDANKIIKAWILVDTVQVFEGNLQLKKFQKNFKTGEFEIEVVVYADNDSFFTSMGDKYISDIDLSQYDHIWNVDNVRFSWTQSVGFLYRYPLIDFGYNWQIQDISGVSPQGLTQGTSTQSVALDEIFPAISRKYILDRIFQENGFNYDSDFLNSDYFKNEIIPLSSTNVPGQDSDGRLFKASNFGITQSIITGSTYSPPYIVYKTLIALDFEDPDNLWNSTDYYYENTDIYNLSERFNILMRFSKSVIGGYFYSFLNVYSNMNPDGSMNPLWDLGAGYLVNGDDNNDVSVNDDEGSLFISYTGGVVYLNNTVQNQDGTYTMFYQTDYLFLRPGEKIRFVVMNGESYSDGTELYKILDLNISNEMNPIGVPNTLISINNLLPKKIKQRDFILSTCKEYNLYIEPSKEYPNTLIIEPRDDFYENGIIKDWTKKLDLLKPIQVDILAETQNRITTFTHKEDKDYTNALYKQTYNEIFGQYDFDSGNEFAKSQNKKVESIFSPTPLSQVPGSVGFIIPLITKDFLLSYNTNAKGRIDTNIRSLQWGGLVKFNNTFDKFSFDGQIIVDSDGDNCYPYAGNLDNPYDPTLDNHFGRAQDVFYTNDGLTENGLFNRFWRKTMLELTNKDSRVVTAYFYLTSQDIYNFSFSDKIFVEFDGESSYYKVNKIMDYNPGINQPCKVELLKTQEIQVNTFRSKYIGKGSGFTIRVPNRVELPTTISTGRVEVGPLNEVRQDGTVAIGSQNQVGYSSPVLIVGEENTVRSFGKDILVVGRENEVQDFIIKSITAGDNNIVATYSENIYTFGDNNIIGTASENIYLLGNNNTVSDGVTSSYAFGDNITLTQSNTLYIGGEVIFSGTVSGIPMGLEEVLDYDNRIDDMVLSMTNSNIILGDITNDGSNGSNSVMVGGFYNVSKASQSFMGGGSGNILYNTSYSGIISGINNIIDGGFSLYNFIGGGEENRVSNIGNAILGGNNNSSTASNTGILGGAANIIHSGADYSGMLGGGNNRLGTSSLYSAVIGGWFNQISNSADRSVVIGGSNINGTQSDTVYTPNLYVSGNLRVTGNILGFTPSNVGLQSVLDYSNVAGGLVMNMTASNISIGQSTNYIYSSSSFNTQFGGGCGITGSSNFNLQVGANQLMTDSSYNIVGGRVNILTSAPENGVSGRAHNLNQSNNNQVSGSSNLLFGCGLNNVSGSGWVIYNSYMNNVSGQVDNLLPGTSIYGLTNSNYNVVGGLNIGLSSSNYGIFVSRDVKVNSSDNVAVLGGTGSTIYSSATASFTLGGTHHTIGTQSSRSGIIGGVGHTIDSGVTASVVIGGRNMTATQSNTIYSARQIYSRTGDAPTLIASVGWGGGLTASSMAGYVEITPDSSALSNGTLFILSWSLKGKHYTTFTPANDNSAGLTFWTEYDQVNNWTKLLYSGTLVASTTYKWHYTNNPLI